MPITHSKISLLSNNGDPNLVQPTDWNAAHSISGTLDLSGTTGLILGSGGIVGGLIPNTPLAFSATPVFDVTKNASYSMLLTGNVTSSSTTGTPINGQLLSLTISEDATGGRTFVFPANFIFTSAFTFATTALAINELTFKFDGANWHLVSNSGTGSGGNPPNGNNGDLQFKAGAAFGASGLNDNGTLIKVSRDSQFLGPNPYIDVRAFGVRPITTFGFFSTTGSINSGSPNLTLASASSFVNGDGITITGAGPAPTMATPTAPTVVASNSMLPGTGIVVANGSGATTYQYQIVAIDGSNGATIASTATSITNGAATLGANVVNVASWTRSQNLVTVTTAATHNIVVGSLVSISVDQGIAGMWKVFGVPDGTHFTFVTATDARNSALTSGGNTGIVNYYTCNHLSWTAVTGAGKYLIYGRTAGSMALIGVSLPENTLAGIHIDPLYNTFDDFGSVMSAPPSNLPGWYPATPPVAVKNQDLITKIVSGAGTVNLVLANNASNTVVAAGAFFDNTPNLVTAAIFAQTGATQAALYFPAIPGQTFYFYSVANLSHGSALSVLQAGSLVFFDTLVWGGGSWVGQPKTPLNAPSFSFEALPSLSVQGNPGIYSANSQTNMSYVSVSTPNGNQSLLYLFDMSSNIPASRWEHMSFSTSGSTDCMGRSLIIRENINGGAVWSLDHVTMVGGTCPVVSSAPAFQHTQAAGPMVFDHVFLNHRTMYFGGGCLCSFDSIYDQAGAMSQLVFANTGAGQASLAVDLRINTQDTTQSPFISYFDNLSGNIRFFGAGGLAGYPLVTGPGAVNVSFEAVDVANANYQNTSSKIGPVNATAIDGIISTNGSGGVTYSEQLYNMALSVGTPYKTFVRSLAQAAPTCVVSSGGSLGTGTPQIFTVAPFFADGSEGTMSPPSLGCTPTTGNQTITISWASVPGAIGYDLYVNGASFACNPPWTNGTTLSYVWTSVSPCGVGTPKLSGGGPTSLSVAGVSTPQLKVAATNGGGVVTLAAPALTANRNQNFLDASGNILLDSVVNSAVSTTGEWFDTFSAGLGSNYTNLQNTIVLASGQFTGGTGGAWNAAALTTAGLNFASDQYAAFTLSTIGGGNAQVMACVRMQTGTFSGYCGGINTNSNTMFLQVFIAGGASNIGTVGVSSAVGDYYTISIVGQSATLRRFVNGVLTNTLGPSTVTNFASGTPGVAVFSTVSSGDNFEAGNIAPLARTTVEQDWNAPQHFVAGVTLGNTLNNALNNVSGNSGRVGQTSGTLTNTHFAAFDASGNIVDSGAVVGATTALSSISAATTTNTFTSGDNAQRWNWALTTAAKTAFIFGESTAAINGAGSQFLGQFVGLAGSTAVPLNVTGSLTGSQTLPTFSITPTWNTTGVVDAALLVNATNTASGTGSLLADFQVGAASKWKVDKTGATTQQGTLTTPSMVLNGSNSLTTVSGNSGILGQTSGTLTNNHFASFDANGNIIDSGAIVGATVPLNTIVAATGANSINNGDNAQTWNWALTTAAKTAFKFTESTAAVNGVGQQFLGQFTTLNTSTAVPLNVANTLSGSQTLPALSITPTWNTTGVVDAALLINAASTASGTGSLLLDAQLSSISQWRVDKAGNSTQLGTANLGGSAPNCTPGSAGGSCLNEGTAPTAGAGYDVVYADGTQQAVMVNNHNTGNMPISRLACVNVTPVTVSANVTTDQNLMACTLSPNLLNVVGRTLKVWTAALYATPVASVATINTKVKLCTVSGCGSGTVITLASYTSSANPGAVTNNSINTENRIVTQTAGAASAYEVHGNMIIDLNTTPGAADSTFSDTNTTTVGTIDSTTQLFLQVTGAFNTASASNSLSQRQLIVEVLN